MLQKDELKSELTYATIVIKAAGETLINNQNKPFEIEEKEDKTLVSNADKESSQIITSTLSNLFPNYAILDEETIEDGSRFKKEYCWVIDPLDGTKEFLNKEDNFGIIIGLMKNFEPVLGLTYRPKTDELVYAVKGKGAFMQKQGKRERLFVSDSEEINLLVSASRSSPELEEMIERISPNSITKMGSSLKIVEVAKANATAYLCPRTSIMHLWDLCGTSLILEEAGGKITDVYGNPFDFSQRDSANKKGIIAANNKIHNYIFEKLYSGKN